MPRICTICTHDDRTAIDQALIGAEANRRIAARFDITEQAIRRHKADHLPADLVKAQDAAEVSRADGLLDQIADLRSRALAILHRAEQAGELRTALMAIREARETIALLLEVEGRIQRGNVVNILVAPQWIELRAVIVQALAPFPDARASVAQALVGVDYAGN